MTQEEAFQRWLRLPGLTPEDRQALYALAADPEAFTRAFLEPLTFGTAGLRGTMGSGPGQMNEVTVSWATAGVAALLKSNGVRRGSVVICGDSRHHSDDFAQIAARTMAAFGHHVKLWLAPTPTPVLSWAVREWGADCGIVITASHNPKEYNGFKVYGPSGGQLLARDTKVITAAFNRYMAGEDLPPLPNFREIHAAGQLEILPGLKDPRFTRALIEGPFAPFIELHRDTPLSILYSSLHGTGGQFVTDALKAAGFTSCKEVPSQAEPDGNFPTLARPNPEDPAAFEEAFYYAATCGSDLILATDPDCDRMGAAVCHDGEYVLISGNQIAALMIDFLTRYAPRTDGDTVISTVVSSPFAKRLAMHRGLSVRETLTGFKYIADVAEEMGLMGDGHFFFGFEESYGYLYGDHARDKDGVIACLLMAACARAAKAEGETLIDRLEALYSETGYWYDRTFDITLPVGGTQSAAQDVMSAMRTLAPQEICGRPVRLTMDYLHGTLYLPPENMLQYTMPEGSIVTVRPSGTEPKMKCYVSACARTHRSAQTLAEDLTQALRQAVKQAKEKHL